MVENLNCVTRKTALGVSIRSSTNWPIESQKKARNL